jgi:hypothetical protein
VCPYYFLRLFVDLLKWKTKLIQSGEWEFKFTKNILINFKVENGLQIRNEQYSMARHLLDRPGTVSQLNMGSGKTRVVMPMLVLELTKAKASSSSKASRDKTIRLFVLTSLLSETLDLCQRMLTASLFRVCIFQQPFHRRIDLTTEKVNRMLCMWTLCKKSGGLQIMAPEHSLSLQLKLNELNFETTVALASQLRAYLDRIDLFTFEILDESDALLSHKFQLVYAVGTPGALSQVKMRSLVIQVNIK